MDSDLGGFGFWLAIAIVFVAIIVARSKKEQALQQTIRASIEKNGHIDPVLAKLIEDRQRMEVEYWKTSAGKTMRRAFAFIIGIMTLIISVFVFLVAMTFLVARAGGFMPWEVGMALIPALVVAVPGALIAVSMWRRKPTPLSDAEPIV